MTWKRKIGGKKMERKRKDKTNNICFSVWREKKKGEGGGSLAHLSHIQWSFFCDDLQNQCMKWTTCFIFFAWHHVRRPDERVLLYLSVFVLFWWTRRKVFTVRLLLEYSIVFQKNEMGGFHTKHVIEEIFPFLTEILLKYEIWNMKKPPRRTERVFYLHSPPAHDRFPHWLSVSKEKHAAEAEARAGWAATEVSLGSRTRVTRASRFASHP